MNKKELIISLKNKGLSRKILSAFSKVPRENFIPENSRKFAYYDDALPLEKGATISQPSTIAFMLELLELKKGQKILEIGSGSGYVLALLSEITKGEIYGIEIISSLAKNSEQTLSKYKNIKIYNKNGSQGLKEKAPFDRILISAESRELPESLYAQLKDQGIIVAPINNSIFKIKKQNNSIKKQEFPGFVFVPLTD
ncbi:MAG: protein-L-isoaspartate O-methyltransferase [Nanoarchaeota archaeon]